MGFETGMELCTAWAYECTAWAYETLGLTQLFHRLDVIAAVTGAGVFFMQRSPAELLTLHTLPRERTQKLKRGRDSPMYATYLEGIMELRNEEPSSPTDRTWPANPGSQTESHYRA